MKTSVFTVSKEEYEYFMHPIIPDPPSFVKKSYWPRKFYVLRRNHKFIVAIEKDGTQKWERISWDRMTTEPRRVIFRIRKGK